MTDDILSSATRALRETTGDADEAARFTRARIMASLHHQRQRRASKLVLLVPLAAILLGGSAWAASGGAVPHVVVQLAEVIGLTAPAQPAEEQAALAPAAPVASAADRIEPAVVDPADLEPAAEPEPEPARVEEEPPAVAPVAPPVAPIAQRPAPSAAQAPQPAVDAEGTEAYELYRKAHRAHFEAHDPAAALSAWDAYLRAAPGGRFALEASYNRGICLVRLGRASEARQVLRPFADGAYGGYRQAEAQKLVAALEE